jgi:hypothetical protein
MSSLQFIHASNHQTTIFVEDELTRQYLSELWRFQLSSLHFVTAGSILSVKSLAKSYKDRELKCWGIVDRDYRWTAEHIRNNVITLQKHEIENYLLDPESIHHSDFNYNLKLSQDDIADRIKDFVNNSKYWFTCCYILADLDLTLRKGFPPAPKNSEITDIDSIVCYITNSRFTEDLANKLHNIKQDKLQNYVQDKLNRIEEIYQTERHIDLFPGKTVLNNIRSVLHRNSYSNSQASNIDFAKEIAQKQLERKRIPEELLQIREAILH